MVPELYRYIFSTPVDSFSHHHFFQQWWLSLRFQMCNISLSPLGQSSGFLKFINPQEFMSFLRITSSIMPATNILSLTSRIPKTKHMSTFLNNLMRLPVAVCIVAVSYTHLDVYKRQVIVCMNILCSTLPYLTSGTVIELSARFVDKITFRSPGGGNSNTFNCSSAVMDECKGHNQSLNSL